MKGSVPMLAQVNDITSNIFDGIDSLMLSVETAKGDFYKESVKSVQYIIEEAERRIDFPKRYMEQQILLADAFQARIKLKQLEPQQKTEYAWSIDECMASCAVKASFDVNAKLIVVLTTDGHAAFRILSHSPKCTIVAATASLEAAKKLTLRKGIYPLLVGSMHGHSRLLEYVIEQVLKAKFVNIGDTIVLASGNSSQGNIFNHLLKIITIE